MVEKLRTDEQLLRGAWASLTIPSLVDTSARAKPTRNSFSDAPDIADWSDLPKQNWTTSDLSSNVTLVARQLLTLGLSKGDPVLVAMPNQAAGVAAILATMLAGFVPCPVSVVASAAQFQAAAEAAGARAIITVNRYAHLRPSITAREAASRFYGLRFICAFGPDAPEGIISLDDWRDDELFQGVPPPLTPAMTALLTIDHSGDNYIVHRRSHAQIISEGLALSAVSGLSGRGSIVATFAPVSAAGFVATVAGPLISGANVQLHGPFDVDVLERQLESQPEAIVVLPALVENAIRFKLGERLKNVVVITRTQTATRPIQSGGRVTELIALGEVALMPIVRDQTRSKQKLPRIYPHPVATALPQDHVHLEMTISGKGLLTLQGFGVARPVDALKTGETDRAASSPFETRWLAHGDGSDHIITMPDDEADILQDGLATEDAKIAAA
jgi:mycobactin salicyl-AMP ligase